MAAGLDRRHAVVAKARRGAPDDDVAVAKRHAHRPIRALQAAEEKRCRKSERDGHDRRVEVALVAILMQREAGAGNVAVDEACVGFEVSESCVRSSPGRRSGRR